MESHALVLLEDDRVASVTTGTQAELVVFLLIQDKTEAAKMLAHLDIDDDILSDYATPLFDVPDTIQAGRLINYNGYHFMPNYQSC